MYEIYKINGDYQKLLTYQKLESLSNLRFDLTELDYYNFRYNNKKFINNFKREIDTPLKRIGFISNDFTIHRPSGSLSIDFFENLIKYKNQFEIFFYTKTDVANRFLNLCTIRKDTNLINLKKMILSDNIDILIDMQGHMCNNYNDILIDRLAPIQMHFLGYPGTLGYANVDYLIADKIIIPEESTQFYREKIAYLPNCYQCNSQINLNYNKNLDDRKFFNLPKDAFVFCNFNYDYKLDRNMFLIYLKILNIIPNSILFYKTEKDTFDYILKTDGQLHGIDKSRLINGRVIKQSEHFKRLSVCDLGLDNYRLNGHTTSSDLLIAGTPFITYPSDTYQNRVGKSLLLSLDLEELVCYSSQQYINLAVKLATDTKYYESIRKKLLENRTKILFNPSLYTNNFVNLMFNVWKNHYQPNLYFIWKCYKNTDSTGNDIIKIKSESIEKIHEHAIKNEECIAYNSNGVLKNKILDKSLWIKSDSDLWVKEILNKDDITKFSNNYIGEPKYIWKFFPYIDCINEKNDIISIVNERNQLLRDIAENNNDCLAFNTKGELKKCVTENIVKISNDSNEGIWIREKILIPFDNEKKRNEINKEYNLPLISIIFLYNEKNINNIFHFFKNQIYLNTELLIIVPENSTIQITETFNIKLCKTNNKNIESIFKTFCKGEYYIIINNLMQYDEIQYIYIKYIKNNNLNDKNITSLVRDFKIEDIPINIIDIPFIRNVKFALNKNKKI
jgi:hypothetical protein